MEFELKQLYYLAKANSNYIEFKAEIDKIKQGTPPTVNLNYSYYFLVKNKQINN